MLLPLYDCKAFSRSFTICAARSSIFFKRLVFVSTTSKGLLSSVILLLYFFIGGCHVCLIKKYLTRKKCARAVCLFHIWRGLGAALGGGGRTRSDQAPPQACRLAETKSGYIRSARAYDVPTAGHTATQPHSHTAAQRHSGTAAQPDSTTAPQRHSGTAGQPHSGTAAQPHSGTAAQPHSRTAGQRPH